MKCLICKQEAHKKFDLPVNKCSGGSLLVDGEPVNYYECTKCFFLFAKHEIDYTKYWDVIEEPNNGRVLETMRLYLLSDGIGKSVLDYGCGKGFSIQAFRELGIDADGCDVEKTDLVYSIDTSPKKDIVVACEVVEHFSNPVASFKHMASLANKSIAFQTAYYDPQTCHRDWWYLGPANGHISLYSPQSLNVLAEIIGVKNKVTWKEYLGIQSWKI
jgi:SAM-dependent methyltransferase